MHPYSVKLDFSCRFMHLYSVKLDFSCRSMHPGPAECAERLNIFDLVFQCIATRGAIFDGIFATQLVQKGERSARHLCSCDQAHPSLPRSSCNKGSDQHDICAGAIKLTHIPGIFADESDLERCEEASLEGFDLIMRPKIDDSTALLGLGSQ